MQDLSTTKSCIFCTGHCSLKVHLLHWILSAEGILRVVPKGTVHYHYQSTRMLRCILAEPLSFPAPRSWCSCCCCWRC